ncbi:TPA: hypothetical protein ACGXNJ_005211 [Bacillus cereus]
MKKRNIEFLAKKTKEKKIDRLKVGRKGIIVGNIKHLHAFKKDDEVIIVNDDINFGKEWVNCRRLKDGLKQTVPVEDFLIKE